MALPPGFLDELRGRVSLAQVAGRKVAWDSRKSNVSKGDYWAPCPFHQEKSASFHVDDRKGYYYCFGCQAKGDALKFVQETENVGFMEAVERLAREAGLAMPAQDPAAAAKAEAAKGLVEAMEAAVRHYRALLASSAGAAEARAYLDRRGVKPATRERFELGFGGTQRAGLYEHLRAKGFAPERIFEAGLARPPADGGPYDVFRDRILFPIRDGRGRAIAFGGRAMAADARAKYLNSPETPLFDKGRTLYNLGPARAAAGKTGALVVVEGYMDAIALSEAGIEHVVAPLGTAVTADQLQLMWRLADEPTIALDGDAAGQRAAGRVVDLALPLLTPGKGLRFAVMPPGRDPDEVVRAEGRAAVEALLAASRPIVDLIWAAESEGAALDSPERRAAFEARLKARIARVADPTLRAHYQAEIKARLAGLFAPAPAERRAPYAARPRAEPRRRAGPRARAETRAMEALPSTKASLLARAGEGEDVQAEARVRESAILAGCLNHPDLAVAFETRLERVGFVCPDLARIRDALLAEISAEVEALAERVAARLGRDPRPDLIAVGPVAATRHLRADADPDDAARAVSEALDRQAAWTGQRAEVREAERDMMGAADEGVTWRLREAAEAAQSAAARPLADAPSDSQDESSLSAALQSLIDQQIWKKPQKR